MPLKDKLELHGVKHLFDEPMSRHTTFNIGGPADILAFPKTTDEIKRLCLSARELSIPVHIIGNGSNLLVSDSGIRGLVIKTQDDKIQIRDDGVITAGSASLIAKVSAAAQKAGLSGLEFACGIPGTTGGAVYMNAGAYGGEMKDIVTVTEYLDAEFNTRTIENSGHEFSYRKSVFSQNKGIILSTAMELKPAKPDKIRIRMDEILKARREKQPVDLPSAGSVFKRPEGYFAGQLIEDAGLKGYTIGGAQVSEKHAGFIVNTGGAACDDVLRVIWHIQNTVRVLYGVELETELKIIQ